MTLDEAILHAKEVAETCNDSGCAADHIQLAEWLRQARGAGKAARWYTGKIQELEAENDKMRKAIRYAWRMKARRTKSCKPDECLECPYTCSWRTIGSVISELGIEVWP